jgi:UDP-N-acetylglucosamine acyltransferase
MPHIHPTAIMDGDVQLADDVVVGPYCILTGKIRIGPGSTLVSTVHLNGPLWMGVKNVCYPGACIGFAPQDLSFTPSNEGAGVVIGDGNTFREHVTIHRATKDKPTTIGNNNYWMASSHAGHDAVVGNNNIFANGASLAGHAQLADRIVIGGGTYVHQFVRIGRNCMLSGASGTSCDIPPFFLLRDLNATGGLNIIGMRRSGMPRETIDHLRWAFRTLYRAGATPKQNVHLLREREHVPEVKEMMDFILASKRPIVDRAGRARHSLLSLRRGGELDGELGGASRDHLTGGPDDA